MNDTSLTIMDGSSDVSLVTKQGLSVVSSMRMNENGSSMDDRESSSEVKAQLGLLHNVALTGRRKEYALLKASYKRIQKGQHPSEIVLISGLSGTGKSKLAESIREPVTLKRHGFFVSGKFNQLRNEPYSALVEAFSDLCDLVSQDPKTCNAIAQALEAGDRSVLSKVIPNLSMVTDSDPSPYQGVENTVSNHNAQASFTQMKLACRKFLSVIANRKHPVVLLVDDLQWADSASIGVIQSLITDLNSKYILVVGTYRSDEEEAVRVLLDGVKDEESCLRCTSIHLENFGQDQVASLIADCTSVKSEATRDLACLIIKRTTGNPFVVMRFIEMLEYNNLLEHDNGSGKWVWSLDKIQQETVASDNVVEVVKTRIQRLNHSDQSVLKLAAVLGFSFEIDVIKAAALAQTLSSSDDQRTPKEVIYHVSAQVDEALNIAETQGIIEGNSNGSFKFCHDGFCDCLYSMVAPGRALASTHLLLARVMQKMNAADSPSYVYGIANQLTHALVLINSDTDRLDCAQYSLRAAKLALTQSAFSLAARFAGQGLAFVDVPTKWSDLFYSTALDLHCIAAEALYCSGQPALSTENLQLVFQHGGSTADIARARTIHVHSLGAQARVDEAVAVAFGALRELGVKLSSNPSMRQAGWQIIKTKSKLRGKTDDQLLALSTQELEGNMDIVNLLLAATHYASIIMSIPHFITSITALMQLTLDGKCSLSSPFCNFGMLETAMGNIENASRLGRLAIRMHEIQSNKHAIPGAVGVMHAFLNHWRAPLYDSLEPVQKAYSDSFELGIFDAAFRTAIVWMQAALFCGYPLEQLEPYMRAYCEQMNEFDLKNQVYLALPYWQLCLNLLGQSDDPILLTGEAMNQATYEDEALAAKVQLATPTLNAVRIILGCHFEYSHLLQILLTEYETFDKRLAGHFGLYTTKFFVGLSYVRLYRSFKKRAYKRKARKIAIELKKWTLDGCPNTKPLWALMDAELATLVSKPKRELIGTLFLDAIQESALLQNTCWEAMANERAARYYQTQVSNEVLARLYMERAIELYESYGAFGKIEFLQRTSTLLHNGPRQASRPAELPRDIFE